MTQTSDDQRAIALTIAIFAIAGFASTFSSRIADPLVPTIASDLGASVKTIALLATAFALPYALIQPILGPIGDAVGKLAVMRVCVALLALALLASAFAPDETTLFVLRVIAGAAAGGVIPLALAAIGDRVGMEGRQVAISRFLVAIILGQLAGSSLSGALALWIGWRGVFVLAAILAAGALAAVLVFARRATEAKGTFDLGIAKARYRALLAMPRARALFAFVFVEAAALFGLFPFAAVLLERRDAGGSAEAGLAIAGFAIGGLLYSALVRTLLRFLGMPRMVGAGGILAALAILALVVVADWRLMAAAFLAMGLGFYMMHNSFQTAVTELAAEARGSATALHACFFFLGGALGPALIGAGFALIGEGATLALAAAAIACLGPVAGMILVRTDPARRADTARSR
ncbi:MFS transporter [Salinarimonas ramus]|uniref:MFS transporter n=1 Tax=Salinarimonas ramus TaxID=690164 RepID=A0A917QFS8_9HYPH|nr:MFS transporter [Salinarimonas ramus]GGK48457.1 MFS transporter [Salinarimonas ramus]